MLLGMACSFGFSDDLLNGVVYLSKSNDLLLNIFFREVEGLSRQEAPDWLCFGTLSCLGVFLLQTMVPFRGSVAFKSSVLHFAILSCKAPGVGLWEVGLASRWLLVGGER